MSMGQGSVLHRISSSVFRTGKKPPLSPRTRTAHPTVEHAVKSAAKAFCTAAGVQAAISLCLQLASVRSMKKLRAAIGFGPLLEVLRTSARFGAFVGIMNFAVQFMEYLYFRACASLMRKQRQVPDPQVARTLRLRSKAKNVVTAALCAGALMLEAPSRRHNIALFLFPRALDTLTLVGVKKGLLPRIPYAPTILFTLCEVFIMTSWIKFPQYMDRSYNKLIYKWSGDITKEKMHHSVNHPDPSLPVGCKNCGFHEEESCLQYLFWDFLSRWQQHSMMYVPLYLVPRLLMRGKTLLLDPIGFVGGYVHNVLVSGLFLSTYVLAAKSTICVSRSCFATSNKLSLGGAIFAAAATGPSVLWERPSRRVELLLYVSQRAGEVVWAWLKDARLARDIPGHDALMFFVTCFTCLHAREYHRDCLRPLLKLVMTKVFGRSILQQQAEAEEKEKAAADAVMEKALLHDGSDLDALQDPPSRAPGFDASSVSV